MDYKCDDCVYGGLPAEDYPCIDCKDNNINWLPEDKKDLIYTYEVKQRAEKDYKDALFVYANCPVGTAGRNEAYNRIWILSNVLGYSEEKVEKDMQEAEDEQR